ncbi:DNA polymerase III PolC-type [Arthrobacter sp. Hiyo8]|nr:DNA polymerase III PolC-type [Arthrobacter sp. Hiyo8]
MVEEASWLMRPPENHDHFEYHNTRIHGIRAEDVAGAPRFGELFPEIGAFIGGDILAAHNAAFDLGVIRSGLEVSGLPGPAYEYVCTVMLSRRCYSLVSNSLPYAAEEAGVPLVNHHDAAEDARACAGILVDIAHRNNANSIAELYLSLGLAIPKQQAFQPGDGLSKQTLAALAGPVEGATRPRAGPASGMVPASLDAPGAIGLKKATIRSPTLQRNRATPCSGKRSFSQVSLRLPGPKRNSGQRRWVRVRRAA